MIIAIVGLSISSLLLAIGAVYFMLLSKSLQDELDYSERTNEYLKTENSRLHLMVSTYQVPKTQSHLDFPNARKVDVPKYRH